MRPLKLPSEVVDGQKRQEVMRAWLDEGKLSLSICHRFPASYKNEPLEVWAMLLSDIVYHVADALDLQKKTGSGAIRSQIRYCLEDVLHSGRDSRLGVLKLVKKRLAELPDPDVSGKDECVEIVRIILLQDSINILVMVGLWLSEGEEDVWGNLLYDLISMVAMSIDNSNPDELRAILATKVLEYIDKPSTKYEGHYY